MSGKDLYYKKYLEYKILYTNLKSQIGGGISNVATALFFNDTIYLVQENNNQWNLPGGRINHRETHYKASIREFKEETGGFRLDKWTNNLPDKFRNIVIQELLYGRKPHTKIFLYYIKKEYADKPNIVFKKNNETIDGKWFNIYQLPKNIRYPKSMIHVIKKYLQDK